MAMTVAGLLALALLAPLYSAVPQCVDTLRLRQCPAPQLGRCDLVLARPFTSLNSLLPVLPALTDGDGTLLVTFATPAFAPFLENWACSLRDSARWGEEEGTAPQPSSSPSAGERATFVEPTIKALVLTADASYAEELASRGVVVWLLRDDSFPALPEMSKGAGRTAMASWGTLHYQALMLQRTLAVTLLVDALTQQAVQSGPAGVGAVMGVLLADNDAFWLSNPAPLIAHHYRHQARHPSFVVASDTDPELQLSWGRYHMPCACFIYSRTVDEPKRSFRARADSWGRNQLSTHGVHSGLGAALAWRIVSICHLAMVLQYHGKQRQHRASSFAPSFQATSLGPALRLVEVFGLDTFGSAGAESEFPRALEEDSPDELLRVLRVLGLATGEPDDVGVTCDILAQQLEDSCPARQPTTLSPFASTKGTITHEFLPFELFPPGNAYFGGAIANGTGVCVVHANYASGQAKRELLQAAGLWKLQEEGGKCGGSWPCCRS